MEPLKHECGVAMIRLRKPLSFYKEKYGTYAYGLDRLYLLMEKQHNRGRGRRHRRGETGYTSGMTMCSANVRSVPALSTRYSLLSAKQSIKNLNEKDAEEVAAFEPS